MKKAIIILMAMVVLCSMPVLAKPMVMVTNPLLDNGFMLSELNDEELIKVEGNHIIYEPTEVDNHIVYIIHSGSGGYGIVYNDGHAEFYGIKEVKPDGSIVIIDHLYIPNYNPTNLNLFIKQSK